MMIHETWLSLQPYLGTPAWISRVLQLYLKPNDHVLELGAGLGGLGRVLQKKFQPPQPSTYGMSAPSNGQLCGTLHYDWLNNLQMTRPKPVMHYTGLEYEGKPYDWPTTWHWRTMPIDALDHFEGYHIVISQGFAYRSKVCPPGWVYPRLYIINEPFCAPLALRLMRQAQKLNIFKEQLHPLESIFSLGHHPQSLIQHLGLQAEHWHIYVHTTLLGCCRLVAIRK